MRNVVLVVLGIAVVGGIIGGTELRDSKQSLVATTPCTAGSAGLQSTDEALYAGQVADIMNMVTEACSAGEDLLPEYPYWSQEETLEMAAALGTLQAMEGLLNNLDPPPTFAACHQELLACAALYKQASVLMAEGIDEADGAKFEAATDLMYEALAHMQTAADLIPK